MFSSSGLLPTSCLSTLISIVLTLNQRPSRCERRRAFQPLARKLPCYTRLNCPSTQPRQHLFQGPPSRRIALPTPALPWCLPIASGIFSPPRYHHTHAPPLLPPPPSSSSSSPGPEKRRPAGRTSNFIPSNDGATRHQKPGQSCKKEKCLPPPGTKNGGPDLAQSRPNKRDSRQLRDYTILSIPFQLVLLNLAVSRYISCSYLLTCSLSRARRATILYHHVANFSHHLQTTRTIKSTPSNIPNFQQVKCILYATMQKPMRDRLLDAGY